MNRCSNNKNMEQLKEELKSDLSFIKVLPKEGFSRLENGKIAYREGNEIFDDSEDEVWESYIEIDRKNKKGDNMCKNKHSEGCKHTDDKGFQYAIWKPEEIDFLIDITEWNCIQNYFDNGIERPELDYDEKEAKLVIVYGTYSFQPNRDEKPLTTDVEKFKGGAHVTLTENGWAIMELVDVKFYGEMENNKIAIAALIRTTLNMPTLKNKEAAMTVFLRYGNMPLIDNILNRPGHFEFKDYINEKRAEEDNWLSYVVEDHVYGAHEYFWTCSLEDE